MIIPGSGVLISMFSVLASTMPAPAMYCDSGCRATAPAAACHGHGLAAAYHDVNAEHQAQHRDEREECISA